ncbi:hypothetical protein KIL84_001127 [Mauremys mutica]|uniref:Uncharacterized protein n=1 Tax=Mauremys mutica TaxID=74926 RepID=A0A9D4AP07_9SAUR|nr:hypothetical protein KIL84_001127 [Mauremys mutica]
MKMKMTNSPRSPWKALCPTQKSLQNHLTTMRDMIHAVSLQFRIANYQALMVNYNHINYFTLNTFTDHLPAASDDLGRGSVWEPLPGLHFSGYPPALDYEPREDRGVSRL